MTPLQNIVFPDPELCSEEALYAHLSGPVRFGAGMALEFKSGGRARFDGYFNALGIGKWHRECVLDGLVLSLRGQGEFAVTVTHSAQGEDDKILLKHQVTLDTSTKIQLDLSDYINGAAHGLIWFELCALGIASLKGGQFFTQTAPKNPPSLAVCITTYQREEQVRATVQRLEQYLETSPFGPQISVIVVDNGQSAKIANRTKIISLANPNLANPNLGGAGGFARGMLEASAANHSHCLFMDDDAAFSTENLARVYAFLALAKHPNAAVAGAMISTAADWRLWENGAVFDRRCWPVSTGADLRKFEDVLAVESYSLRPKSAKFQDRFYGGWWFFAFPLAYARHYPYPFFVRGDDINFSLANDFAISTLLGVASFQDDFSHKESAQTLYLDLRNHLVQHLTIKALAINRFACARIALWFIFRNMVRFQYETCEALLLAWNDVMQGPGFFTKNADMRQRRQDIATLINQEKWRPLPKAEPRMRHRFKSWRWRYIVLRPLWRYSLNGHLLPFYNSWANRVLVPVKFRSHPDYIWGSSRITFLDASGAQAYTVQQSKRRFMGLVARSIWATCRFVLGYNALRQAYGETHDEMTSEAYWRRLLGLKAGSK